MADILIRMEMPKHCFNCSTKIDPDNRRCNIDDHVFEETLSKSTCRRDERCPLHELPEHGDLIDLDATVDCQYYDEMYEEWSIRTVTVRDVLYGCLEAMPPAIVLSNKEE